MTDKTQEELEKIVKPYIDKLTRVAQYAFACMVYDEPNPNGLDLVQALTHYINKYYVPRDDVEKIIGEDEPTPSMPEYSIENDIAWRDINFPYITNKLRAEQREKLKSIRREKR